MRPQRIGRIRSTINGAVLLGIVLAVGISATDKELAAQNQTHGGHNNNGAPPVTNEPITPASTTQPGLLPPLDSSASSITDPGIRAHMDAERLKAANDDRHKKLVTDVDKLISLSNELKTDVDKANKDELSMDVIRKAQEIEKLAHDVQGRMKN
jgi:hypothetical protein